VTNRESRDKSKTLTRSALGCTISSRPRVLPPLLFERLMNAIFRAVPSYSELTSPEPLPLVAA